MKNKFDAYISVMPCFKDHPLPVAVFVRQKDTDLFQQIGKQYFYKKYAYKQAIELEREHKNWKILF